MGIPSGAVAVGVLPLVAPFTSVTVYTLPASPNELRYEYNELTPWVLIPTSTVFALTTITTQNAVTTVDVFYNQGGSKLGWWYFANGATLALSQPTSTEISLSSIATTAVASTPISGQVTSDTSVSAPTNPADSTISQTSGHQPSTTPSPLVPVQKPGSKDGLSAGAVAGVAIGCLLAGALVAGLIAFFIRKKGQPRARDSEASSMALMQREKGMAVNTMSLESGSPIAGALENGLPLPLEDKAISGEISKISNLIKNHVQSYYHAGRVSPVSIDYDDLQALGDDMPVSVGTLSTLLGNSATRETALRFCIAWIVVSRMQLRSPPNTTFLPPEVSQCVQMMNIGDRGSKVYATYLSRWRAITAELMQSVYVRNPFSSTDARVHNLQLAANLLNSVLRPYSDSRMDDGQRSRNLEEILKRSAQFAFTLFSQPSTWDFDWENGQDVKSGSLCIFPALVQVRDDNGEPVKPARPFSEAVIRRLDE